MRDGCDAPRGKLKEFYYLSSCGWLYFALYQSIQYNIILIRRNNVYKLKLKYVFKKTKIQIFVVYKRSTNETLAMSAPKAILKGPDRG